MLNAEIILFCPTLLFFSIIASIEDFRFHKISNLLILKLLLSSLLLNIVFFIRFFNWTVFLVYFGFIIISFIFPFILWLLDFWKAGDVKFFFALSTLLHPSSLTIQPLTLFILFSIAIIFIDAILTRTFEFKPKFKVGVLLPLILAPLFSIKGISIPLILLLMLLGKKLNKAKKLIILVSIVSFIIMPLQVLKTAGYTLVFFIISSMKFKGRVPSAPLISASFIYLLVFGNL